MALKTADWSVPAYTLYTFLKKFPGPGFEPTILGVAIDALPAKPHKGQLPIVDSNI